MSKNWWVSPSQKGLQPPYTCLSTQLIRKTNEAYIYWFPNINLDGDPVLPEGIVEASLLDYFTDLHLCLGVSIATYVGCDFVTACGVEEAILAVFH